MYYLKESSHGKLSDLGSSFEAELIPLHSPEELKSAQEAFKKAYPKADHYPYAFRFGGLSRSSDDGEPSGTGGRALLGLLEQKEMDECLLIVARYFGGTKLGIPRLRRAFLESGGDAIKNAKIYVKSPCYLYSLELTYSEYNLLNSNQTRYGYHLENTIFDVKVLTTCAHACIMNEIWEKLGFNPNALPSPQVEQHLMEVNL